MVNSGDALNPITSICIVSDKNRCPNGYEVLSKAHDEPNAEADVWKDGMFSFSKTYRYICISRNYLPGTFVYNVVADIALLNSGDIVSPGFIPLESTEDTREKALRKKLLCVRYIPRESAIDAVSDVVLLVRQRKPPAGFTLAGDIDGILLGFKYSQIPAEFGRSTGGSGAAPIGRTNGVYPNLPYPIHPGSPQGSQIYPGASQGNLIHSGAAQGSQIYPGAAQGGQQQSNNSQNYAQSSVETMNRQYSSAAPGSVLEGIPFQLSPAIKVGTEQNDLNFQQLPRFNKDRIESDYFYAFNIEQSTLSSMNF